MLSLEFWWVGILSYGICHVLHIEAWRRKPVKRSLGALFSYFIFIPVVCYLPILLKTDDLGAWAIALITHLILASNYIAIYPAFQASSPTIQILTVLHRHPLGLSKENILNFLATETILEERIYDLEKGGLITHKDSEYQLTVRGNILASLFMNYRRAIGLPIGEG